MNWSSFPPHIHPTITLSNTEEERIRIIEKEKEIYSIMVDSFLNTSCLYTVLNRESVELDFKFVVMEFHSWTPENRIEWVLNVMILLNHGRFLGKAFVENWSFWKKRQTPISVSKLHNECTKLSFSSNYGHHISQSVNFCKICGGYECYRSNFLYFNNALPRKRPWYSRIRFWNEFYIDCKRLGICKYINLETYINVLSRNIA